MGTLKKLQNKVHNKVALYTQRQALPSREFRFHSKEAEMKVTEKMR